MAAIRDDALPKQTNQIDAENLIPRFDDISSISLSEHYIFDVKPMDEYVCKNCHTEIDHDHQCERVHRKSLCEKCVNKKWRVCWNRPLLLLSWPVYRFDGRAHDEPYRDEPQPLWSEKENGNRRVGQRMNSTTITLQMNSPPGWHKSSRSLYSTTSF